MVDNLSVTFCALCKEVSDASDNELFDRSPDRAVALETRRLEPDYKRDS